MKKNAGRTFINANLVLGVIIAFIGIAELIENRLRCNDMFKFTVSKSRRLVASWE